MVYCTSTQVLAIVDSDMTVAEVTELIEETDAYMDTIMDTGSINVHVLRMISRTMTAIRVMLKDPQAQSLGDHSMDRSYTLEKLNKELETMIMGASGGISFRYGYADLWWPSV